MPLPCFLSLTTPLLSFEASLILLPATLTHFALSSFEWALRISTLYSISRLNRLRMKPRISRSFGETLLLFTRPCFALPPSERLFLLRFPLLLKTHLLSGWNLLFLLHTPALTLLFLAIARLLPTLALFLIS